MKDHRTRTHTKRVHQHTRPRLPTQGARHVPCSLPGWAYDHDTKHNKHHTNTSCLDCLHLPIGADPVYIPRIAPTLTTTQVWPSSSPYNTREPEVLRRAAYSCHRQPGLRPPRVERLCRQRPPGAHKQPQHTACAAQPQSRHTRCLFVWPKEAPAVCLNQNICLHALR